MIDVKNIIKGMSLKDKIALCSGGDFWHTKAMPQYGIPEMMMSDGSHGMRKQERGNGADMLGINKSVPATCIPAASLTACSFNPQVTEELGGLIGEEAAAMNVGVVLGPGANLKRNPLCGRNFEYFSEDPYLSGKMAAGWIRGLEGVGVASSLKHFACNSQEKDRFNSDSILEERTLRELYLRGYEIAVKEGKPSTIMSAYNKINGVHCSDSRTLLTGILRDEWGFDGMVVTDWGGMNDRIAGFQAGCDLSMPGGSDYMEKDAALAVQRGLLKEEDIDRCVERILTRVMKTQEFQSTTHSFDEKKHHEIARKAVEESAVLLKNEDGILPLKSSQKTVFIGAMADHMRYQGAGSSHINPLRLTTPKEAMPEIPWVPGCLDDGSTTEDLLKEAVEAAKKAKIVILFMGLPDQYESEGFDRDSLQLPNGQIQLLNAIRQVNKNIVVLLFSGCVVECPWIEQVKALLYMGLPGQAGGEALRNLLFGVVSPSGRLAETWPISYADCASSHIYAQTKDALYEEGIYVGYRYYEKANVPVRFPFGYGLSYTTFSYADLQVEGENVSVTITNTGSMAGKEAVLLWMKAPQNGIHRPIRELKAFDKLYLEPGESKTVTFHLDARSFAIWQNGWKIPGGTYTICVGSLSASLTLEGDEIEIPSWQAGSFYEHCTGKPTQEDLEKAIGHSISFVTPQKGHYTMDNTVMEMKKTSLIMRMMFLAVESTVAKGFDGKKDYSNPDFRMMINASAGAPLRSMQISGGIKGGLMFGLLDMANGHFFRGIKKMLS